MLQNFPWYFMISTLRKNYQQKDSCSQTVESLRMRSVTSLMVQDDNKLNTIVGVVLWNWTTDVTLRITDMSHCRNRLCLTICNLSSLNATLETFIKLGAVDFLFQVGLIVMESYKLNQLTILVLQSIVPNKCNLWNKLSYWNWWWTYTFAERQNYDAHACILLREAKAFARKNTGDLS